MTTQTPEGTTTPAQVRAGVALVATEAAGDIAAGVADTPLDQVRSVLFDLVPAVSDTYAAAAATLGADWYEELRDAANPPRVYVPEIITRDRSDDLRANVALATSELADAESIRAIEDSDAYMARVIAEVEADTQAAIADALRDTVTENAVRDPDATGWRRYARPEACKFCLMLAAKGAIYSESTARFAAHRAMTPEGRKGGNCMCVAGPAFDDGTRASVMQRTASRRKRSAKDSAALREYLNRKYPDAPG